MKLEILGSVSAGVFAVAGAWLTANGSSFTFLAMAVVGALVAVLELDPLTWRKAVLLFLFNGLVGTFGGPILLFLLGLDPKGLPPAALVLLPFILGWAGHTALSQIKAGVIALAAKRLGGAVK